MHEPCIMEALHLAGRIILENGGETYRAEDTVERMGQAFGMTGVEVFAVPSGLFISFTDKDEEVETSVHRIRAQNTHLAKVNAINQISRRVSAGELNASAALTELKCVYKISDDGKPGLMILGTAISSAGFAVMFGGGWIDALAALVIGALVQVITTLLGRFRMHQIVSTLLCSMVITFVPLVFNRLTGLGIVEALIAGTIMPLLPGLGMTIAVQDTMRGDIISGVGHGIQAILTATLIAAGALVANRLFMMLDGGVFL